MLPFLAVIFKYIVAWWRKITGGKAEEDCSGKSCCSGGSCGMPKAELKARSKVERKGNGKVVQIER